MSDEQYIRGRLSLMFLNQPGGAMLLVLVMMRDGQVHAASVADELGVHSYLSIRFLDLLRLYSYGDDSN